MLNGLLFQMQHHPERVAWIVVALTLTPVLVITTMLP